MWKKNAGEGYGDLMSEETWTAEELFEGMTLQAGFIAELEKHGLIRAVARDVRGGSLYSAEARDELEKVLGLVELGYKLEDIAAIAKRVGLPAKRSGLFRRLPLRLRAEDLSERTGVPLSRVERWIEISLLRADLISDRGAGLFGRPALDRVRLLADLEDAGLVEDEIGRVLEALESEADPEPSPETLASSAAFLMEWITELRARREANRRLERSLVAGRKRLIRARRSAAAARRKQERSGGARRGSYDTSGDSE